MAQSYFSPGLLSAAFLEDYHGAGAYIVARDCRGVVVAIRRTPELPRRNITVFDVVRGRPTRAEQARRAKITADDWRAHVAALEIWAATLAGWHPTAPIYTSSDLSCTEFCARTSVLAWTAHDALNSLPLVRNIRSREEMLSAYDRAQRLGV